MVKFVFDKTMKSPQADIIKVYFTLFCDSWGDLQFVFKLSVSGTVTSNSRKL